MGIYHNPPMMIINDNEQPSGFLIDFINDVAKQEQWKLEFIPATWPQQIENLESGVIDVLAGIAYSKERGRIYAYTAEPVVSSWGQIYAQSGATDYLSILDLAGKNIGVLDNDIYFVGENGLRSTMQRFGVKADFKIFKSYSDILDAVEAKTIDVGAVSRLTGEFLAPQKDILKTPILFHPVEVHFAGNKRADIRVQKILNTISQHLVIDKQLSHSVYTVSVNRWLNHTADKSSLHWLRYAVIVLLIGMAFALFKMIKSNRNTRSENAKLHKEQALLKQQSSLLGAMENISDILMILNNQGEIIHTSSDKKNFGDYQKQEIIGREFYQFFSVEDRIRVKQALAKLMTKPIGTQYTLDVSTGSPDSSSDKREMAIRLVNHLDDPSIQGIFVVMQCIEQIEQITSEVLKSKAVHDTAFNTVHDAVVVCNEHGDIIDFNRAALKLLRLNECDKTFIDLMTQPTQWPTLFQSRQTTEQLPFITRKIILKTSETHSYMEFDGYLADLPINHETAVLISLRDVTTQQLLKRQLESLEQRPSSSAVS